MNTVLLGIIASVEGSSSVFDVPGVNFDANTIYDPPELSDSPQAFDFDANTLYFPFED